MTSSSQPCQRRAPSARALEHAPNDVAKVVASASRFTTLEPGDVILTGTPAGVGHPSGRFLVAGDTVRVEVEGVGAVENTISGA